MDAKTPATPPTPAGDPTRIIPVQDGPIKESAVKESPVKDSRDRDSEKNDSDKNMAAKDTMRPARPKGPNASAIVLGLVALAIAGLIIAGETMDVRVNWSQLGPGAIVGIGLLLVVLGAVGLVRRHDDV